MEEENAAQESTISAKFGSNLEDRELVQEEQSETKNYPEGGSKRRFRGIKTDEAEISILGMGGMYRCPIVKEMQVSTVNKVLRTRNSEEEVEVLQSLASLGYLVLNNARAGHGNRRCSHCSGASCIRN